MRARVPSIFAHSWSFVYFRGSGTRDIATANRRPFLTLAVGPDGAAESGALPLLLLARAPEPEVEVEDGQEREEPEEEEGVDGAREDAAEEVPQGLERFSHASFRPRSSCPSP